MVGSNYPYGGEGMESVTISSSRGCRSGDYDNRLHPLLVE